MSFDAQRKCRPMCEISFIRRAGASWLAKTVIRSIRPDGGGFRVLLPLAVTVPRPATTSTGFFFRPPATFSHIPLSTADFIGFDLIRCVFLSAYIIATHNYAKVFRNQVGDENHFIALSRHPSSSGRVAMFARADVIKIPCAQQN